MWIAGGWDWAFQIIMVWSQLNLHLYLFLLYQCPKIDQKEYLKVGNHAGKLDHRLWGPPEKWRGWWYQRRCEGFPAHQEGLLVKVGSAGDGAGTMGCPALPRAHGSQGSWPRSRSGARLLRLRVALQARQQQLSSGPGGALESEERGRSPWGQEVPCPEQLGHQAPLSMGSLARILGGFCISYSKDRPDSGWDLGLLCLLPWWQAFFTMSTTWEAQTGSQPTPLPWSIGVNRFNRSHRET